MFLETFLRFYDSSKVYIELYQSMVTIIIIETIKKAEQYTKIKTYVDIFIKTSRVGVNQFQDIKRSKFYLKKYLVLLLEVPIVNPKS